jgi:hypothetical protein
MFVVTEYKISMVIRLIEAGVKRSEVTSFIQCMYHQWDMRQEWIDQMILIARYLENKLDK